VSPLTAGAGHLSAERPLDYRYVSVSERRRRWELRVYPAVRSTGRWLAVAIPVADVALVVAGVLDLWTGVLAGAVLELVLVLVVVAEARVFRRAYRGARADGLARLDAVRAGMRGVWPPVVVALAEAEIGLWQSLWWGVRRRRDVPAGELPVSYGDRFTVMLWAISGLGALELAVVHVLTAQWPVVRWSLFALGSYALLWVVGFGLSLRQRPHLLRADELVLRFGHVRSVRVPLQQLVSVATGAAGHKRNLELDGDSMAMSVMGDTNVELRFSPPVEVDVAGRIHAIARIRCYADGPREAASALRNHVLDRAP
jgi:hypothetical protein